MKMPTVEKCCCGCTLYGGALIIATFFTTGMFLNVINTLAGGTSSESMIQAALGFISDNNHTTDVNATEINEVVHLLHPLFRVVDGMVAVRYILLLLLCLCLVYGIVKRSSAHILPWLITNIFMTIQDAILMIGLAILVMMIFSVGVGIGMLFVLLVGLALNFYFLVVIYSYYKQVKKPPHYEGAAHQEHNYNA